MVWYSVCKSGDRFHRTCHETTERSAEIYPLRNLISSETSRSLYVFWDKEETIFLITNRVTFISELSITLEARLAQTAANYDHLRK